MEEMILIIDWFMEFFFEAYNFFIKQHPIIQACVFMPLASLVIGIFIAVAKLIFGRSLA